jgi:hypothetical protein
VKRKPANNLITDLPEPVGSTMPSIDIGYTALDLRVPPRLPPANGLKLSAEDEVLFRYFCIRKHTMWISAKQFNRDIPWCMVIFPFNNFPNSSVWTRAIESGVATRNPCQISSPCLSNSGGTTSSCVYVEGRKDAESQQDESYHSLVILVPI